MSDIVEKTIYSLHGLISGSSHRDLVVRNRDFQNLVDAVSGVTNKHEQDVIIQMELSKLKHKLSLPCLKLHQVRDCLVRIIYCEMLGYEAGFSYIHAIKLAQQGSLPDKRIGYLVATLFLHPEHELVILLINCIQKDLKSSNVFEICMALTASVYLVNAEMAPLIIDLIKEKLCHPKELVRKKAVLALQHFIEIVPSAVRHVIPHLKICIGDSDPEVVSATINALCTLAKTDASSCKDAVGPLLQVFRQVLSRKLPMDFDYHGLPGPWIQIQILRLFSILGQGDKETSDLMYDTLKDVLGSVDVNHNIGYAVLYECVSAATEIYPNHALLESASSVIGKFLQSRNSNMKYMGLKALARLVKNVHPTMVTQHQSIVMDCLRHPDISIRDKTLDVLFCLTNSNNIQIVCPKMMEHLSATVDEYAQSEIIRRILEIIDRHSSDPHWSFSVVNDLMLKSTSSALPSCIHFIKKLVYGVATVNTAVITNVQKSAVEAYFHMLQNRDTLKLSPEIILLAISVIGDYYPIYSSIMSSTITGNDILTLFSNVLENYLNDVDILFLTLMMVKTLIIHCIDITMVDFSSSLKRCMESLHPSVRQGAYELFYVIKNIYNIKGSCSTKSAECDAELFDWTLSFLDSYVIKSLECGSDPYKPLSMRGKKTEFNNMDLRSPEFDSHQFDVLWTTTSISSSRHGPHTSVSTPSISSENAPADSHTNLKLPLDNVKKVWNKQGCDFLLKNSKNINISTVRAVAPADLPTTDTDSAVNVENPTNFRDEVFAKALFGNLCSTSSSLPLNDDVNNKPVNVNLKDAMSNNVSVVTSVAQDSNSSTSSIQKISSDSGPSSDLNSPLDPSSVTLKSDSS